MGRPQMTMRESRLMKRIEKRKTLLKKSSVLGFKRPEGFGTFEDDEKKDQKAEQAE